MTASAWISAILTGLLSQTALAQSSLFSIHPNGPGNLAGTGWRPLQSEATAGSYLPIQSPPTHGPIAQASVTPPPSPGIRANPANNRSITINPSNILERLPAPMQQMFGGFEPDQRETYYPYADRQAYGYYPGPYAPPPNAPYNGYSGYDGYYQGDDVADYGYAPYSAYGQDYYAPAAPAHSPDSTYYPSPTEYAPGYGAVDAYGTPLVANPGNSGHPAGYNDGLTNPAAPGTHNPYSPPETGIRGNPSWPPTTTRLDNYYAPTGYNSQITASARPVMINGKPARFRPWSAPDPGNGQPE